MTSSSEAITFRERDYKLDIDNKIKALSSDVKESWRTEIKRIHTILTHPTMLNPNGVPIPLSIVCFELLTVIYLCCNIKIPTRIKEPLGKNDLEANHLEDMIYLIRDLGSGGSHGGEPIIDEIEILNCFHRIRKDANTARHLGRTISMTSGDAHERINDYLKILEWFYCRFKYGPKLPHGIYDPKHNIQDESIFIEALRRSASAISDSSIKDLEGLRGKGKYIRDKYLEPSSWKKVLNEFLNDEHSSCLIITAPTGKGKTCFLCENAEQLRENRIVFFWHHMNVPDYDLGKAILARPETSVEIGINDAFRIINQSHLINPKLLIIIDGINEHPKNISIFDNIIKFIAGIEDINKRSTKIILGVRDKAVDHFIKEVPKELKQHFRFNKDEIFISMPDYEDIEQRLIYERYCEKKDKVMSYESVPKHIKYLFKYPLMIRLFTDAYGAGQLNNSPTKDDLFNSYYRMAGSYSSGSDNLEISYAQRFLRLAASARFSDPSAILKKDIFIDSLEYMDGIRVFANLVKEGYLFETDYAFDFAFEEFRDYMIINFVFSKYKDDICLYQEIRSKPFQTWIVSSLKEHILQKLINHFNEESLYSQILITVIQNAGQMGYFAVSELLIELEEMQRIDVDENKRIILLKRIHSFLREDDNVESKIHIFRPIREIVYDGTNEQKGLDNIKSERIRIICDSYLKLQRNSNNKIGIADALLWRSDLYFYNRKDDYVKAIKDLKRAVSYLKNTEDNLAELKAKWTELFLAHVHSDNGDREDAYKLIDGCKKYFIEKCNMAGEEIPIVFKRGKAYSLYYSYMLGGDASGEFINYYDELKTAKQIFMEIGDNKCIGRCKINEAIATLFTQNDSLKSRCDKAIRLGEDAISHCEKYGDIQGKSYGIINLASFNIMKANFIDEANYVERNECIQNSLRYLQLLSDIYKITEEEFILTLGYSNLASIEAFSDKVKAAELMGYVMKRSRDDFFNRFDAEMCKYYYEGNKEQIMKLGIEARKRKYIQADHRSNCYLYDLTSFVSYKTSAMEIAAKMGWGDDIREGLFSPWYAGIFLY